MCAFVILILKLWDLEKILIFFNLKISTIFKMGDKVIECRLSIIHWFIIQIRFEKDPQFLTKL